MRNKKVKTVLSLLLLVTLVLSGCGSSNGSTSNEGNASPSPGTSGGAASDAGSADNLRAYEGTTLRVLLKEGYEINVIQQYVSEFEEKTGIDVKLEVYDETTARQKFILDATSKTGAYDVTAISFWYFPEYQKNGWVEPLDELMKNSHPDWYKAEDIPTSALDTFSADGKRYAMPHTIISGLTYFRKDIFEKHNLQAPKTTQDILALAPIIKELEPEMLSISGRGAPNFASLGTYLGWAWGYGAQLLDDQFKPHANSPEMVQALTDYVNMLKEYGPKDAASLNHVQAGEKVQSGNTAMFFDTTGWGTIFEDPSQSKINGNVGYAMIEGPAGRPLQWIYMEGLGINSASKNKEAAWLFLQWRMSRETTMKELTELARTDVPNLYVLNSPEYKAFAEENNITDYTNILAEAWEAADIKYWPFVPEFAEIGDAFMTEISAAIAGQQDVKTALDKAQKSIEDILAKAGY